MTELLARIGPPRPYRPWPAYKRIAALVVLAIGAILIATLDDSVPWGGDEALYVMHARNIAQGRPYSPTPFIANPDNAINPAAYPPGLPLLLAPVYHASGLDWVHFKVVVVSSFVLFLLVFALLARDWLPTPFALLSVAAIGLHPYVWKMKETVPTEFPFLFFAYASLLLLDRALLADGSRRIRLWVIGAICAAAAYLTRSVGIVIFPALVLTGLWHTRRIVNPGTLSAVCGFALAWVLEQVFKPDLGTYTGYMDAFHTGTIWNNILTYELGFRFFLQDHAYTETWEHVLLTIVALLAVLGFVARTLVRVSAFEFFFLGYGALLLIYPVNLEPDRYSFPLWPIVLLYALAGTVWLGEWLPRKFRLSIGAALLAVLALNFTVAYRALADAPPPRSAEDADSQGLYAYIREHIPERDVIIARKPTVIALLTDRRASIWPEHCNDAQFRDYMQSLNARYILQDVGRFMQKVEPDDALNGFVARNGEALQLLYSNESFRLFRSK